MAVLPATAVSAFVICRSIPWRHRTAHLQDPDAYIVELAQEIPRRRGRLTQPGTPTN